ncbi:MAG: hypothetical protein M1816_002526 [Peltula sp. TS41687]|nr:MAG: hypothetical protein M1816_002526 [Peltula sp. TS41687]
MANIPRTLPLVADHSRITTSLPFQAIGSPVPKTTVLGPGYRYGRGSRRLSLIPLDPSFPFNEEEVRELGERYYNAEMDKSKLALLIALFTAVTIDAALIVQKDAHPMSTTQKHNGLPNESSALSATMIRPLSGKEIDDFTAEAFRYYQPVLCDIATDTRGPRELENGLEEEQFLNHPTKVMLIYTGLNRRRISSVFMMLLVAGMVLGIVVGVSSKRPEIGIALSAAICSLSSCLLFLTRWHQE